MQTCLSFSDTLSWFFDWDYVSIIEKDLFNKWRKKLSNRVFIYLFDVNMADIFSFTDVCEIECIDQYNVE